MMPDLKNLSVFLIGDPPSERFHSMDIYNRALSGSLAGIPGLDVLGHQWPAAGHPVKNRYLGVVQGYWNRHLRYPSLLKVQPADLYHILDHSYAHLLSRLPPERTIITCHDLTPLMMDGYGKSLGGKLSLASFRHSVSYLHKARHLITDSVATKKALIDILGLADKNITVVPLGIDDIFFAGKTARDRSRSEGVEYVLQVGATVEPYKNTLNILKAFSILHQRQGDKIRLLKVGKPYTRDQQIFIQEEGLTPYIEYTGYVERSQMPDIYRRADVLLMPSLYEGFGLPVLEAMACGVPVVTSERGSLPEVAGDAALYVDPENHESISAGTEIILKDIPLRNKMIHLGLQQAAKFSWQRTAIETVNVYQRIPAQDEGVL